MSIKSIENPTDRSLTLLLWVMRRQMFCDGNKRVATVVANHEMIKNGCGVISIPVELDGRFKSMLVQYYETNDMQEIKQFLFDHCIDGIEFERQQNISTLCADAKAKAATANEQNAAKLVVETKELE